MSIGRRQLNLALMKLGFTRTQSVRTVNAVLEEIYEKLALRETVSIQGFGSFHFRQNRRSRMWDPRLGKQREVRGRLLLRFRPSAEMLRLLGKK